MRAHRRTHLVSKFVTRTCVCVETGWQAHTTTYSTPTVHTQVTSIHLRKQDGIGLSCSAPDAFDIEKRCAKRHPPVRNAALTSFSFIFLIIFSLAREAPLRRAIYHFSVIVVAAKTVAERSIT